MGEVYREFERDIERWKQRYAGRPQGEMLRLWLVALEREQLVAVSYREETLSRRLAGMPISPEAREVIQAALNWAWRDEEMHAIWIRGALLRTGRFLQQQLAYLNQWAGAIAGWTSSVQQHRRWREAPFTRALAWAISLWGWLLGKVPAAARKELRWRSFKEFCAFNVEAEETASLCWRRLTEIAEEPRMTEAFRRMWRDEDRHARIFALLERAFDEADRLRPDASAESLAREVREVGEMFLPASRRRAEKRSPVGQGGPVIVREGPDKRAEMERLLDEVGLEKLLPSRRPLKVVIKASFMLGYHRADRSTHVDPALLEVLAARLRAAGVEDVAVLEATNLYDRFFANRGVAEVARYLGFDSPLYRIADAGAEQMAHDFGRGLGQHVVSRAWAEADFRIVFGKMRSHPVDYAYLCLGGLESLGARNDDYLFAERQAQRDAAVMMVLDDFPAHLALLDAHEPVADGLVGILAGPRPRAPRRLYGAADVLALDMVALRHLGIGDPRRSLFVGSAVHWFGEPLAAVVGPDSPIAGWRSPWSGPFTSLLSLLSWPVYQYGSGRGQLFVPELDEEAFPPRRPEPLHLHAVRFALRKSLGFGRPG